MTAEQANELTHDTAEWIVWAGGDCPLASKTLVQVQLRFERDRDEDQPARWAKAWQWGHDDGDSEMDVIGYRVVSK